MASSELERDAATAYLQVDGFLANMVGARALLTAFELGLIEAFVRQPEIARDEICARVTADPRGWQLLLDLLATANVLEEHAGRLRLTRAFTQVLPYRDLLEAKLEWLHFVLPDVSERFTALVQAPGQLGPGARTWDLFCYQRAFHASPENEQCTRRWMRITTCLTRYEARVCLTRHDFGAYRRILDIGGNSGEFVLQVLKRHPRCRATVVDLPLVCEIGRQYVRSEPEADRITFLPANALTDSLPAGFDLVTFKSMLHDWPDAQARALLARAAAVLEPGGRLLVFERGPGELSGRTPPYALLPFLPFWHCFRPAQFYQEQLARLGFQDIALQRVDLELPFHLLTGRKPGSPGRGE